MEMRNRMSMSILAAAAMSLSGAQYVEYKMNALEPRQRPAWTSTRKIKKHGKRFGRKHQVSFEKLPEWLKNYVLKKRTKYLLRNEKRQRNYEKCLQNGIFKGHPHIARTNIG
jgi:hypothetical protein